MKSSSKMTFKNLKPHIADAIKASCYRTDARLYKIANEVHHILTYTVEPGVEIVEGLSKIIDKTIKESVAIGCDLSVIVKGILLGTFRSSPFIPQEAHKTIRILITEILKSVFKYKGDVKQLIEGVLAAIVIISKEFKLNEQEALIIIREDMVASASTLDAKFADDIKEGLPKFDEPS
jgi:hypothetical protein